MANKSRKLAAVDAPNLGAMPLGDAYIKTLTERYDERHPGKKPALPPGDLLMELMMDPEAENRDRIQAARALQQQERPALKAIEVRNPNGDDGKFEITIRPGWRSPAGS